FPIIMLGSISLCTRPSLQRALISYAVFVLGGIMVGHSRMLTSITRHPLIVVLTGFCVALLLVSSLSAVHASFKPSLVALPNSAAPQVAGAHVLGNHNAADPMTIGLLLQTRNQPQQQQLLKSLYSPQSSLYH